MPNEVKPCPFCGSKRVDISHGASWVKEKYNGKLRVVGCKDCGVFGGVFNTLALSVEEAENRAIESWNNRVFCYQEYARQMRVFAVRDESGNVICSPELWEQIASIIAGDLPECMEQESE